MLLYVILIKYFLDYKDREKNESKVRGCSINWQSYISKIHAFMQSLSIELISYFNS